ncbi:MAG: baseplate wedge protein 53 [Acidiferrobacterales bacterium]
MGKSRYSETPIINGKFYGSWTLPVQSKGYIPRDLLKNVATVQYVVKAGDRIDHLAAKFYNDESYWWVIALCNNINYPFQSGGFKPGVTLSIAVNVKDILDQIFP